MSSHSSSTHSNNQTEQEMVAFKSIKEFPHASTDNVRAVLTNTREGRMIRSALEQKKAFVEHEVPRFNVAEDETGNSVAVSEFQEEVVIGSDDRILVSNTIDDPWRKIAALRIYYGPRIYAGTGWFISPTVLITAGHCVFDHREGKFPTAVEIFPGLNGKFRPFGSAKIICTKENIHSNDQWVNYKNPLFDYGVIFLDKPISEYIGYFAFASVSEDQLKDQYVSISGYPLDRDKATKQYYHSLHVKSLQSNRIIYDIDTYGGQSGSPIWMNINNEFKVVIGIHTTGNSNGNSGILFTEEIFAALQNWKTK